MRICDNFDIFWNFENYFCSFFHILPLNLIFQNILISKNFALISKSITHLLVFKIFKIFLHLFAVFQKLSNRFLTNSRFTRGTQKTQWQLTVPELFMWRQTLQLLTQYRKPGSNQMQIFQRDPLSRLGGFVQLVQGFCFLTCT